MRQPFFLLGALVLGWLPAVAVAQSLETGSVAGVVESQGAALPGVRVTVTGPGLIREAVTDIEGRYELGALPVGKAYSIAAMLPGFKTVSHAGVVVLDRNTVTVNFDLRSGCLEGHDFVDFGLVPMLRRADVVARVVVTSWSEQIELPTASGSCRGGRTYTATVLEEFKRSSGTLALASPFFKTGTSDRWDSGDEFIVFLRRESGSDRLLLDSYAIPVRRGRIVWPRDDFPGVRHGDPIEEVVTALRKLASQGR